MKLSEGELSLIRDALDQFLLDGFVETDEETELLEGVLNKVDNRLSSMCAPTEHILPEEYNLWKVLGEASNRK